MIRPTRCCMAGCTAPAVRSVSFAPALAYCEPHYWAHLKLAGPAPAPPAENQSHDVTDSPPPADPPAPPPVQQQLFQPPARPRPRPDAWPQCGYRKKGRR